MRPQGVQPRADAEADDSGGVATEMSPKGVARETWYGVGDIDCASDNTGQKKFYTNRRNFTIN